MKRIWNLALGTAVLCAALLCGCTFNGSTAPAGSAPADPLTGQELQYPGERIAAVVIDNAPASTTQWGISSASVVLEALTVNDRPTSLCLAYPSVSAMPTVTSSSCSTSSGMASTSSSFWLNSGSRPPVSLFFSLPCSSFVIRFSPPGTGHFSRYAAAARHVHFSGYSRCVHLNTPPAACKAVQAISHENQLSTPNFHCPPVL